MREDKTTFRLKIEEILSNATQEKGGVVDSENMDKICSYLKQGNLESLNLRKHKLEDSAVNALGDFLKENHPYFYSLDVSGKETIGNQQVALLSSNLTKNDHVTNFKLRDKKGIVRFHTTEFDIARRQVKDHLLRNKHTQQNNALDNQIKDDFLDVEEKTTHWLVDVDNTLINAEGKFNTELISALKKAGINSIYLFTSYDSSDLAVLISLAISGNTEEAVSCTRMSVVERLQAQHSIAVKRIITSFDGVSDKPIGSYWENYLAPHEDGLLAAAKKDSVFSFYQQAIEEKESPLQKQREVEKEQQRADGTHSFDNKSLILNRTLDTLPEGQLIVIDDNRKVKEHIDELNNGRVTLISSVKDMYSNHTEWKTENQYLPEIQKAMALALESQILRIEM